MNLRTRRLASLLAAAAAALGLGAAPALAAPELGVTLERDETEFPVVHRSDERVDFTAKVKNLAPKTESAPAGTVLTCEGGDWTQEESSGFGLSFQWLSNGAPATGTATQIGPRTSTYETQAADEGNALQCVVTAKNDGGAGLAASFPRGPSSAPAYSGSGKFHPTVTKTEDLGSEEKYTCTPPSAGVWTGSPAWSYQWLRNDEVLDSAEDIANGSQTETYTAHTGTGEPDHLVALKCKLEGTNAGGTIITISNESGFTGTSSEFVAEYGAFPPVNTIIVGKGLPNIVDPNRTSGPVSFELELPGGEETFAYEVEQQVPGGWTCETKPASGAQSARVLCGREDALSPEGEFPALTVVTALGADVPDVAIAKATAFGGGAAPATDEVTFPIEPAIPFGLETFTAALLDEAGSDYTQAGGHPFEGLSELALTRKRALVPEALEFGPYHPIGQLRQLIIDVPRGVAGNQLALPELCPGVEEVKENVCPPASAVGGLVLSAASFEAASTIYAIEPEFSTPAQFAFSDPLENVYTFSARLRPEDGYAVSLEVAPAPEVQALASTAALCDFGVVSVSLAGTVCKEPTDPGANPKPLFTNPTRCNVPLTTRVRLNSWEDPTFVEGPPFANAPITGCDKVPFEPTAEFEPTSDQADSGSGLDVELSMPTEGLEDPFGISQSHLRKAEVTLPEGMAVNPSAGQGLGACEEDEIKLGTNKPISCPGSSKIGTVEIETPVIEDTLEGAVYIAEQGAVDGSLIGFYMVFDSPENGILVKLPAKVTPNPDTGQLVVTVEDSPQQPFSAVRMHFPGGDRATLLTPPKCGTYEIEAKLTPWSGGAPVTQTSTFEVEEGPNGGPCPDGSLTPGFSAGSVNPLAGATSPFNVHLTRPDGSQRFRALNLAMPPGLTAYLRNIPYCPEAVLASISREPGSGEDEIDNPSCPAASGIGRIVAGTGAGGNPLFVDTGRAYLAGPYKGAPLSIVAVVPAVAGPLDLGSVVVRNAVYVNPRTAQVQVISDPIPTILHGLLLDVRDVRVLIDRPAFTLNPTSCEPMAVAADVRGEEGAVASLTNRFQVGGCRALKFEPRLFTRLFGGTKRGAFPKFRAVLKAGAGEANIGRMVVTIPRSEFVEQGHFRTICTRVQYAADACPKGSVYGRVKAFSPLVDYPLEGPVRLRSSDNELPDLVMTVHGPPHQPIEATAVARIDSIRGQLRATIGGFPDVPVSKAIVTMQGGKKGLLVNSRNICRSVNRTTVNMRGQNGKIHRSRPVLNNTRCKKKRKQQQKRRRR